MIQTFAQLIRIKRLLIGSPDNGKHGRVFRGSHLSPTSREKFVDFFFLLRVGGFVGQAFEEFANSSKRDFARPAVAVIVRHEVTNQKKIGIS